MGWLDQPLEQPGDEDASAEYLARLWREHRQRTALKEPVRVVDEDDAGAELANEGRG